MNNDNQDNLMSNYSAEQSTADRSNESPDRYTEDRAIQKDNRVRQSMFKLGISKLITTFGDYDLTDKLRSADDIDIMHKEKS